MAGEACILAKQLNAEKSTGLRPADYAKQSQFREPRLPHRFAPRNNMRRQGTDHAKQSQFPGSGSEPGSTCRDTTIAKLHLTMPPIGR